MLPGLVCYSYYFDFLHIYYYYEENKHTTTLFPLGKGGHFMTHILLAIGLIIGSVVLGIIYTLLNDEDMTIEKMTENILGLPRVLSEVKNNITKLGKGA